MHAARFLFPSSLLPSSFFFLSCILRLAVFRRYSTSLKEMEKRGIENERHGRSYTRQLGVYVVCRTIFYRVHRVCRQVCSIPPPFTLIVIVTQRKEEKRPTRRSGNHRSVTFNQAYIGNSISTSSRCEQLFRF